MYEEKSTEQIAAQVGLSENATRQLIFRARAAFKKALIGDVDTTGMSAAAILSVAARKAASEGKKVGAAALTLIALVVMSLTVFPGLNRTAGDQMAGAPTPGTSQDAGQSGEAGQEGSIEIAPTPDAGIVDDAPASEEAIETPATAPSSDPASGTQAGSVVASPTPVASDSATSTLRQILRSPEAVSLVNSDSASQVFALDQDYTAIGDNGLVATFTFNPTSGVVFSAVKVEIYVDAYVFDFKPANKQFFSGKNADGLDLYILVGDATFLYDEFGKKWSETTLGKSRVKIEVVMDPNGTTVKSINLALFPGR
jgi:RNA polymerase sigma-70 factor (ECF subfamily)